MEYNSLDFMILRHQIEATKKIIHFIIIIETNSTKSYWLLCVTLISDGTIDHFEDAIEDPTNHECPAGEFPVTYKMVVQGSK